METSVLIASATKPYAAFPPPQWCFIQNLIKINLLVNNSIANSLIWSKFEVIQDFITVLITHKFDEDRIKSEGASLETAPIIRQWELLVAVKSIVLIQSAPNPYAAFPPPHIKFDQDWPCDLRDIQVGKCGRRWMDSGPLVYYKLTLQAFKWAKKS